MIYAQTQRAPWEGTASDCFYRRKNRREAAQMETFEQAFSRNNIFASLYHIAEHCGRAAGPDGVSPRDLTPSEMGSMAQVLSRVILAGDYVSSEPKLLLIPKDKPGEYRPLSIPILADRAAAHVLQKTFSPRFEPLFLANSHGFRPGRGPRTLLRDLNARVKVGRHFLALDDVEKAFDSVRIDDVMDSFGWAMEQTGFPADKSQRTCFCTALRQVLAMGDMKRTTGIPQGCPVSPLMLNVLLHHRLDTKLTSQFTTDGYFRFADNLIYAARNPIRCQQFLDACERHLDGLYLKLKKQHPRFVDLDENVAPVLGFELSRSDQRLAVGMGSQPLADLADELREVHYHRHPSRRALLELQGWIESWGPALDMSETTSGSYRQILLVLRGAGISFPKRILEEIRERMTLSYGALDFMLVLVEMHEG